MNELLDNILKIISNIEFVVDEDGEEGNYEIFNICCGDYPFDEGIEVEDGEVNKQELEKFVNKISPSDIVFIVGDMVAEENMAVKYSEMLKAIEQRSFENVSLQ